MTPIKHSNPRRRHRWRASAPVGMALLCGVFLTAMLAPMPTTPNEPRTQVIASVEDRLPGWNIVRTHSSWEGAWAVVASCGALRLGFQWVPGHGLSPGDAWLHPEDPYSADRLASISDDRRFLVWFDDPIRPRALSCRQELARVGPRPIRGLLD
jgi:hypothetical protein